MNTPLRLILALAAGSLLAVSSVPAQSTYIWANSNVAGTPPANLDWFTGGPNTQGTWTGGTPVSSNLNTIQFFANATTQLTNTAAPSTQAVNLNNGGTAFQLGTLTLTGRASATSNAHLTMNLAGDALNFSAATGTINLDSLNATRTITYNVANNIQLGTAGSSATLTLAGSGNNTFNFSGSVSELQAGGGSKLIKSGSSTAILSGAVTVSGGVEVNAGSLALTGASNNITGGFTLNGGALRFNNASTINNSNITVTGTASLLVGINANLSTNANILLNAGSNLSLGGDNGSLTITSAVTGDGSITASRYSSSGHTQILSSTANTFKGTVSFTQGATVSFTVNSLVDSDSFGAGNIRFAEPNSTQTFALGSGAIAPVTLNNRRIEFVTAPNTKAIIQNNSAQAFTINTDLLVTAASGTRTLELGGTGAGLGSFNGNIANGALSSLAITKSGSGTWLISGNMSNTGGVTISGGTLRLTGTNTYSGNTNFNAAGTSLTFAGLQAVSPNTTFVMNTNNSTSDSTARLLDDTGGVNGSTASVPNTFTIQNNNAPGNAHTFFVGNNNTANGGTSSGTTTGSTIAFGTLNWNTYASGTTAYGPIQIQGTNGYRLQINSVVLHNAANLTSGTVGQTTFSPTTANVTLGTVTVGTGNTGQGYQTFVMDGTSSDNRVTGAISNASDFGTSNRELRVTKSNTSTWTLSGGNTYTGTTTVSGGTLAGVGANAFGSTPEIRIAAAGTLSLRGDSSTGFVKASDSSAYSVMTTASGATLNADQATIAGTGAKTMTIGTLGTTSTAATFQVNFTGANNTSLSLGAATGPASTAVATVTFSNGISSPGSLTLASYTSANTSGGETVIFTGTGNTTVSGAITPSSTTLALTKNGAGTTTLAGNNVYTGVTTVNAGVLRLNSANALPGGIASSGGTSALTLSGFGVLGLGNGDFERGTGTGVTQVQWSGSGGFAAYGANRAVDLGGSGATVTWNAGNFVTTGNTLVFGAADATHTLDFQNPINLGGGTRTVQVNDGAAVIDATLSGLLSGSGGGLTKTGAGTLQLSQATTYTGATSVSAGTLLLDGASAAVTSSSGVALSGGTLLISNTSALNNTDRLNDSGTVNLSGGILNFSHTGGVASYSETTGALTVTGTGSQIITSRAASGQTSTLTFASLSLGGNLQFSGDALGLNDRNRIFITAQGAGPIGLLSTYFDPLNNVTTQANYTLANGVGPLSADANVDVLGGTIPDGSAAVSIIQAGTSGNISISDPITTINSLTQTATQAGTVAMAGGILRTDLVIIGNPNAPLTIGATPGEGTLTPKTAGGAMNFNNNYAAPLLTINSVIADNGGASSLIKTGAGTLRIAAGATYTGSTGIGAGTVTLTGAGALPDTSAVDLSDPSSVLHLSGISASSETIGSLTGVGGSSVVIGGKTLALNGASPAPFAGVISGSGGGLTLLAGATQELTGDNTFTGDVTIGANASLSVNKIQTSGAQPLGQGTSPIVMQGNIGTGSTLTYTGAGAGATNRGLSLTGGQGGTVNVTAGLLTVNGAFSGSANFHKAGAGTMVLSGASSWNADGFVNAGTLVLGGDSSPGSNSLSAGNWTVAGAASMRLNTTGSMETSTLTRNGTFNLEAGTLRTNTIAGSGAFVWGAGTITPLSNLTEGSTDRTDPGGSPSGPVVREGTILDYSGNLATSNGSTLDLGGLFTDNGLRYNQISVSGSLSLAATDALNININPYLLRPNTYSSIFTGDWGTLRLAVADSITGSFDTITGIGTDAIGFAADPGSGGTDSFINPATLAMNTYYIEYRTSGVLSGAAVLFHYKVAGSVPEPGSAGLLIAGAALIRMLRRRSDNEGADVFQRRRRMIRRRRSRSRREN